MKIDEEIKQIKNSFLILNLENYDEELVKFFVINFDYYYNNKDVSKKIINDNTFKLTLLDCFFKVSFEPCIINPTKIVLHLKNLNGKLEQRYNIEFYSNEIVKITKTKYSHPLLCNNEDEISCKRTIYSIYDKNFKIYEKETTISLSETSNSGFQEIETIYTKDGINILKKIQSMGESDYSFGTNKSFMRITANKKEIIDETTYSKIKDSIRKVNKKIKL